MRRPNGVFPRVDIPLAHSESPQYCCQCRRADSPDCIEHRLGRKMADQIKSFILEEHGSACPFFQIQLQETTAVRGGNSSSIGDCFQIESTIFKTSQLEVDVIIIVKIVDSQNIEAGLLKPFEQMVTDKAGHYRSEEFWSLGWLHHKFTIYVFVNSSTEHIFQVV